MVYLSLRMLFYLLQDDICRVDMVVLFGALLGSMCHLVSVRCMQQPYVQLFISYTLIEKYLSPYPFLQCIWIDLASQKFLIWSAKVGILFCCWYRLIWFLPPCTFTIIVHVNFSLTIRIFGTCIISMTVKSCLSPWLVS